MSAVPSAGEFIWPIRVYYEDTDVSGVAYHANYLRWLERARTEWLRARGIQQESLRLEHGVAFTVASIEMAYLKPARLDDSLEVVTVVEELRRVSLSFAQNLRMAGQPQQVLARATVRVGCVDAKNFKLRALPDIEWRQ